MIDVVGWDVGGAHLKAVALNREGQVVHVLQRACPLWQGLAILHEALDDVAAEIPLAAARLHAVTMTGELADHFTSRRDGVAALIDVMQRRLAPRLRVFAGTAGLLEPAQIRREHVDLIASANWLASGMFAAARSERGLLIDVGSTTTDLILFANGEVHTRGYTDYDRLRYDELVYLGILRTPVMTIAGSAPFEGHWIAPMNEHFATAADVYRLTGELPEHADQFAAADGGPKDRAGSARRLARMIGRDADSAGTDRWVGLARYFRECQLSRISHVVLLQLGRTEAAPRTPLIGAGIGRFLVRDLAGRLGCRYLDAGDLVPVARSDMPFCAAECLPAAAVGNLARSCHG